ncbi:MAG: GNAT family N-acetyltransferase [bacterium]
MSTVPTTSEDPSVDRARTGATPAAGRSPVRPAAEIADHAAESYQIVRELPVEKWRRFVLDQPDGNIFHTPELFKVFERAKGHESRVWAVVDGRSEVLAIFPPVRISVGKAMGIFARRAVAYGGALWNASAAGRNALAALLRAYKRDPRKSALFTEVRNLSDASAGGPIFTGLGFTYTPHLNYLIDLDRPPEAVLGSIGRRTRKKIRHALRSGDVVVREIASREELAPWYAVLQTTYHRARVPLPDISLFEAAYDLLHPLGMAKFLVAQTNGSYAAVSVELLHKDVIYGWYGGTDRRFSRYSPNEVLTWHILQWGATHGYKVYDFGGAGDPDEPYGVRDFKAKFGGELVSFGRYTLVHSSVLLPISKVGYEIYRRFL